MHFKDIWDWYRQSCETRRLKTTLFAEQIEMGTSLEMKLHGLQGHPSNHSLPSIVVEQFESFVDKVSFPNRLRADYSGAQYYFRSDVIRVSMCDIEKEHCTYVIEMQTGEKPCLTRKKRSLTGLFNEEQLEIVRREIPESSPNFKSQRFILRGSADSRIQESANSGEYKGCHE